MPHLPCMRSTPQLAPPPFCVLCTSQLTLPSAHCLHSALLLTNTITRAPYVYNALQKEERRLQPGARRAAAPPSHASDALALYQAEDALRPSQHLIQEAEQRHPDNRRHIQPIKRRDHAPRGGQQWLCGEGGRRAAAGRGGCCDAPWASDHCICEVASCSTIAQFCPPVGL